MNLPPAGALRGASIATAGTGYLVGDICPVPGGTGGSVEVVAAIGVVPLLVKVKTAGKGYVPAVNVAVTGGHGSGLLINTLTSPVPAFGIPAGSGSIQQRNRSGPMVRQRTIQHTRTYNHRYQGSNLLNDPQATLIKYNKLKLDHMASYWANVLTGGDRTAWDTAAPAGLSGWEFFMRVNMETYTPPLGAGTFKGQNIGDVTSQLEWDFTPPQPTVVSAAQPDDGVVLSITFHGLSRTQFASISGGTFATSHSHFWLIYGVRPFKGYWNPSTNPLVRLGGWFTGTGGGADGLDWHNTGSPPNAKAIWERVIGGALPGETIGWAARPTRSGVLFRPTAGRIVTPHFQTVL